MHRFVLLTLLLFAVIATPASGQTEVRPSKDSLFRRARRLVSEGKGAAGRALVDSILRREAEGTADYGNALYWRGALAETASDAERDYRRVIVEYPLSFYADDALLAMVELEQARGDRAGALAHLQRFVREHPMSTARGIAAFGAARLAFEQRDLRTGCAMIAEARTSVPASEVELRNQIDYFGTRCATVDISAVPAPSATTPSSQRDSTLTGSTQPRTAAPTPSTTGRATKTALAVVPKRPTTVATQPAPDTTPTPVRPSLPRSTFTIQLAAYNTRPEAEQLITKLAARGVKARVSGSSKPFRVRLDFYPTREAAQHEVASLKQRGIIGFVTTEAPRETRSP